SLLRLPCAWVDRKIWGPREADWPRDHRKQVVLQLLESLAWLHVAEWSEEGWPPLGAHTALLSDVSDLGPTKDDVCGDGCPWRGGPPHHHLQVNVGRGLLGVLEQFAHDDEDSGVRTYHWPTGARLKG